MAEVSASLDLKDTRLVVLILSPSILRLAREKTRWVLVEDTAPPQMWPDSRLRVLMRWSFLEQLNTGSGVYCVAIKLATGFFFPSIKMEAKIVNPTWDEHYSLNLASGPHECFCSLSYSSQKERRPAEYLQSATLVHCIDEIMLIQLDE